MLNFKINVLLGDLADRFLCLGVLSWEVLPVLLEPSMAQLRMERCHDNVKAKVRLHHQALKVGVELLKLKLVAEEKYSLVCGCSLAD